MFRLLHVSDLHIVGHMDPASYLSIVHGVLSRFVGKPSLKGDRKNLIDLVHSFIGKIDWLVVTGDLSHTGRRADLLEAARFLEGLTGPFLDPSCGQTVVTVIPGNHDRYEGLGPNPCDAGVFDRVFSQFWSSKRGFKFVEVSRISRIQAGCIDCSLREEERFAIAKIRNIEDLTRFYQLYGNGRVYSDLLSNFVDETARLIEDGWSIVWVIHFAPISPRVSVADRRLLKLQDEESFVAAATQLPVQNILCGHTHLPHEYELGGVKVFCTGRGLRTNLGECGTIHYIEMESNSSGLEVSKCRRLSVAHASSRIVEVPCDCP